MDGLRFDSHRLHKIKKKIKNHKPPPLAVWIQSSVKEIGEPITLGLLHETRHLTNCLRQLRTQLNQVEHDFDITIEVEGYSRAEILDVEFDELSLLYGVIPSPHGPTRQRGKKRSTHRERDRRLEALSGELAKAVERDASLLRRAKEHIDNLLKEDQGMAARDLIEWRDILDTYSTQRLSSLLTSSSERAKRLRRSNPFFAVLNSGERAQLLNDWEDQDDT